MARGFGRWQARRFTPAGFSRPCERVRSKPMWTLTQSTNAACGYAVNMLRKTRARAQVRALLVGDLVGLPRAFGGH